MYIIVIGAGRVGYYLTRALLAEGHEVLAIEKNTTICHTINEEMGNVCFHGDGCEASTLQEVGTGRADMVVAVTGDDEDNLVACQIAKYKFNVPRIIARIRNPKNEVLFKKLGVDVTVSSTNIILEAIEHEVPTHQLTHLLTLEEGLEIVDVRISSGAATIGKSVKDLSLPKGSSLVLVIPKDKKPLLPSPDTVLGAGDMVIAITTAESEEALRAALRGA
ncbi:MAG: TrkA family potassium uptake protein [Dehalococcoidales bacterium]|nr:TrkA family potassium uptake protein [Dehalococcoidales bacterium]